MKRIEFNPLLFSLLDEVDSLDNHVELLRIGIDCCNYKSPENFRRLTLLVNTYLSIFESHLELINNAMTNLNSQLSKSMSDSD